jgi:hypothetical protein
MILQGTDGEQLQDQYPSGWLVPIHLWKKKPVIFRQLLSSSSGNETD